MAEPPEILAKRYEILERIGKGAQGVIHKARCITEGVPRVKRGELVAVKRIRSTGEQQEALNFARETAALRRLNHANIVRYVDSFEYHEEAIEGRVYCLVTEFLAGETLKSLILGNPRGVPWTRVKPVFSQALTALQYASSQDPKVIHRDLKPSNFFLTQDGTTKLIDFGIARDHGSDSEASIAGAKGTWDYMSPDFARLGGFHGDERSDIFSFGVCLYHALTGSLPYPALGTDAMTGYYGRWLTAAPREPSFSDPVFKVLSRARSFIAKCIHVEREGRFGSFAEAMAEFSTVGYRRLDQGKAVYEFIGWLGRGGFAEVFHARRLSDNRQVAAKHLFSARHSKRFVREAKILREAKHPNLVEYVDFVELPFRDDESEYFLVLAFLERMPEASLRSRIKASEAGLDLAEVLPLFIGYLSCLSHLHKRGIIHRDIKPGNLYAPQGCPEQGKIFDLGIAHDEEGTRSHGQVPGTLDYMPPEFATQSKSRGSPQSDIYSTGVTLFQAITRKLPFPRLPEKESEAWDALLQRIEKPIEVRFDHITFQQLPALVPVLRRALAHDPRQRFENADEMRDALAQIVARWFKASKDEEKETVNSSDEVTTSVAVSVAPYRLPPSLSLTTPTPLVLTSTRNALDLNFLLADQFVSPDKLEFSVQFLAQAGAELVTIRSPRGKSSNRTVSLVRNPGKFGLIELKARLSAEQREVTQLLTVAIEPPPPTLSLKSPVPLLLSSDCDSLDLQFLVSDQVMGPNELVFSVRIANETGSDVLNIKTLEGTTSNRTVSLVRNPGKFGSVELKVRLAAGLREATQILTVTVEPPPPTLTLKNPQPLVFAADSDALNLQFLVSDPVLAPNELDFSVQFAIETVSELIAIELPQGKTSNRTVSLARIPGKYGSVEIKARLAAGLRESTQRFTVIVESSLPSLTLSNSAPLVMASDSDSLDLRFLVSDEMIAANELEFCLQFITESDSDLITIKPSNDKTSNRTVSVFRNPGKFGSVELKARLAAGTREVVRVLAVTVEPPPPTLALKNIMPLLLASNCDSLDLKFLVSDPVAPPGKLRFSISADSDLVKIGAPQIADFLRKVTVSRNQQNSGSVVMTARLTAGTRKVTQIFNLTVEPLPEPAEQVTEKTDEGTRETTDLQNVLASAAASAAAGRVDDIFVLMAKHPQFHEQLVLRLHQAIQAQVHACAAKASTPQHIETLKAMLETHKGALASQPMLLRTLEYLVTETAARVQAEIKIKLLEKKILAEARKRAAAANSDEDIQLLDHWVDEQIGQFRTQNPTLASELRSVVTKAQHTLVKPSKPPPPGESDVWKLLALARSQAKRFADEGNPEGVKRVIADNPKWNRELAPFFKDAIATQVKCKAFSTVTRADLDALEELIERHRAVLYQDSDLAAECVDLLKRARGAIDARAKRKILVLVLILTGVIAGGVAVGLKLAQHSAR